MTTIREQAAPLLELQALATPGPWFVVPRKHAQNQMVEPQRYEIGPETRKDRFTATVWKPHGYQDARPNAAFIAAAHPIADLLRAALDENDRLNADLHLICTQGKVSAIDALNLVAENDRLRSVLHECCAAMLEIRERDEFSLIQPSAILFFDNALAEARAALAQNKEKNG